MDDKGESPIEIMGTIFIGLFAMTLVIFSVGPIIDGFVYILSGIGVQIYDPRIKDMFTSIMRYFTWAYLVPSFFISVLFVWGIKAVLKKHQYSAQDVNQFQEDF